MDVLSIGYWREEPKHSYKKPKSNTITYISLSNPYTYSNTHSYTHKMAEVNLIAETSRTDCAASPTFVPERKRPRLEEQEEQELKVAGFSLSAIEEMRQTRDAELLSEPIDQQLRQFQVLDEVATASEEDESGER